MFKVVFVTQDEPFYLPHFFDQLLSDWGKRSIHVVGVVIQRALGKRSKKDLIAQMLQFYGFIDFLRVGSKYVAWMILGIVAVKGFGGKFPGRFSVRHVLLKANWKILPYVNVNKSDFISFIGDTQVDLIISVSASQIFRSEVLRAPRLGCINIHSARLPRNRGLLPTFWALLKWDQEPESGITIHKMDERLDTGAIIMQETFRVDPTESLHQLILRTKRLGAKLVLRALDLHQVGAPQLYPNDDSLATYNRFPTTADVKAFRSKGLRLV